MKIKQFEPKKKRCSKCGKLKKFSQFNKKTVSKDGCSYYCRECSNEASTKHNREVLGKISMAENKTCASYLGIAIAERLCSHIFKDVQRMRNGNLGYDFVCNKGMKIDVKSACITLNHGINPFWHFSISKNKIADYFLLIAFDNRDDLNPLYQWLIPGKELNKLTRTSISPPTLDKWLVYKQPIGEAITCCSSMKSI